MLGQHLPASETPPATARQQNAISMAFRLRADLKAVFGSSIPHQLKKVIKF